MIRWALVLIFFAQSVYAVSAIETGEKSAALCMNCHGKKGVSANSLWPNLAGQKRDYIVKQLKAFQRGDRKDPIMSPLVHSLTDEDINNIALFFSSLKSE